MLSQRSHTGSNYTRIRVARRSVDLSQKTPKNIWQVRTRTQGKQERGLTRPASLFWWDQPDTWKCARPRLHMLQLPYVRNSSCHRPLQLLQTHSISDWIYISSWTRLSWIHTNKCRSETGFLNSPRTPVFRVTQAQYVFSTHGEGYKWTPATWLSRPIKTCIDCIHNVLIIIKNVLKWKIPQNHSMHAPSRVPYG